MSIPYHLEDPDREEAAPECPLCGDDMAWDEDEEVYICGCDPDAVVSPDDGDDLDTSEDYLELP